MVAGCAPRRPTIVTAAIGVIFLGTFALRNGDDNSLRQSPPWFSSTATSRGLTLSQSISPQQRDKDEVSKCKSDMDCSLLGTCSPATNTCKCDPGWTGRTCSVLDLLPYDPTRGHGLVQDDSATWGGSPISIKTDAGGRQRMWLLYASQMALHCPLRMFKPNSRVVLAYSNDLLGPYLGVPPPPGDEGDIMEVLPPFTHGPKIAGPTPDGMYLLFALHSAQKYEPHDLVNCTGNVSTSSLSTGGSGMGRDYDYDVSSNNKIRGGTGSTGNNNKNPNRSAVYMYAAPNAYGPWNASTGRIVLDSLDDADRWDYSVTNPSPVILPNGTILLAFRSNYGDRTKGQNLGIAVADHWSGEFVRRPDPVITLADGFGDNEDPFLWVDDKRRGGKQNYHILAHNQGPGCLCKGRPGGGSSCGAHLFSQDSYTWKVSPEPAYTGEVTFVNGTSGTLLARQRPHVVFDEESGEPLALFNGGSFFGSDFDPKMGFSHTFAFGVNNTSSSSSSSSSWSSSSSSSSGGPIPPVEASRATGNGDAADFVELIMSSTT